VEMKKNLVKKLHLLIPQLLFLHKLHLQSQSKQQLIPPLILLILQKNNPGDLFKNSLAIAEGIFLSGR